MKDLIHKDAHYDDEGGSKSCWCVSNEIGNYIKSFRKAHGVFNFLARFW